MTKIFLHHRQLSVLLLLGALAPTVPMASAAAGSTASSGIRGGGARARRDQQQQAGAASDSTTPTDPSTSTSSTNSIPNIVVILIDDLGWNQVGYHASQVGNYEIQTPNIDKYASEGIEMDRGYMTPWCAPSRAAFQTGRTNIYNPNITGNLYAFDESIGYAGGMPGNTTTIAKAFKQAAKAAGASNPVAYYNGKYGIGGTSWANTPLGMDYDHFVGFWGDSIDSCDGHVPLSSVPPYTTGPFDDKFGPLLMSVLPGYWEQSIDLPDSDWCSYLENQTVLSSWEQQVACKSQPRTPPRIIDLDLLDNVVTQIRTHDYDAGPMLQFFATQTMHTPIQYPKKYDTINNSSNLIVPAHFAQGQAKPVATADDLRIATANALRFVDDVVGQTLQAIKDAGQWDNTIVYFTTDNGGAVYIGTANNNYPLRSSKFSKLEGGVRVPQFISGGWIDKQFPASAASTTASGTTVQPARATKSDTFVFVNDLAPTLLDMAMPGAHKYLLGDRTGAVYGNPMWTYIKNSLLLPSANASTSTSDTAASDTATAHQLPRKVSYAPDFFFDVQENQTIKNFYTGSNPQTFPRLWSPNYPQASDVLMDFGYVSVMPCRPNGVALECCSLNVVDDPQEFLPASVNCSDLHTTAQQLYEIEGGCNPDGQPQTNPLCVEPGGISEGQYPDAYKLWSLYGAAGPFTSISGVPVNSSIPMKCVCEAIANDTLPSEVDYYVPAIMGPTQCFSSNKTGGMLAQGVPCEGGFAFDPQGGMLESYQAQGYDPNLYQALLVAEQTKKLATQRQLIVQNVRTYASREGYTEWPSAGRFPFNAFGLDSCPAKGVTPVPWPLVNIAAYLYGSSDPTLPSTGSSPIGLCVEFGSGKYYCPAKQNANLTAVAAWDVTTNNTHGTFVDGRIWAPMSAVECHTKCSATPEGSAYIGDGDHGLLV